MKLFLLISCYTAALTMPTELESLGPDLKLKGFIQGDQIIFYVQKNRPGYAAFGFGRSMAKGDVVVIEHKQNNLIASDCVLMGDIINPVCTPSVLWVMEEHVINSDGSWMARVTRDSSKSGVIPINKKENDIIWAYSDSMDLDPHSGPNAHRGVNKIQFSQGRALAQIFSMIFN